MPRHQLRVTLTEPDLIRLTQNNVQLQVAMSVESNGKGYFNIVWKSIPPQPTTDIFWKPEYAINWTTRIPDDNHPLSLNGQWHASDLGQISDLDQYGFFQPSTKPPVPNQIAIGISHYTNPQAPQGIHIAIGIKDGGHYRPIFVDPATLEANTSASYAPQEVLKWWYAGGTESATMISHYATPQETGDFSNPDPVTNNFRKKSTYNVDKATWTTTGLSDEDATS